MNTSLHAFVFEWGMLITAIISIIGGYCHALIYAVGTPNQKIIGYVVLMTVMFSCIGVSVAFGDTPGATLAGEFIGRLFLGGPIPMLAGIGLFTWCNPDKWIQIGEDRKYKKSLKKL
jgi:hypothetical protein